MGHDIKVNLPGLRRLSRDITKVAGQADEAKKVLSGVWANTGRADSDTMGRLPPTEASELLEAVAGELRGDGEKVLHTADRWEQLESALAEGLRHLEEKLQ